MFYLKDVDPIEEKLGNVDIIKVIEFFYSKIYENIKTGPLLIDYKNHGKALGLTNEECSKIKANKTLVTIDIFYDEEEVYQVPKKVVIIDKKDNKEAYNIYRVSYCQDLVIKIKKFTNPFIVLNDNNIKNFDNLPEMFYSYHDSFMIIDKENIDYESKFTPKEKTKEMEDNFYNFKYYFRYPKAFKEFNYISTPHRSNLVSINKKNKIQAICGNFGIGKTTSFLMSKYVYKNIVYLNIKALNENENNIMIWRYEILYLEIVSCFKNITTYIIFNELKNILEGKQFYWESIIAVIEFIIKKKLKVIIILDQYTLKFDNKNEKIKQIINIINNDSSDSIQLIISSSLNNRDVRDFLLKSWFPKRYASISTLFNYYYILDLFNSKQLIDNDLSLTNKQKSLIIQYFNYIPLFYYEIKNIEDKKLEEYKNFQIKIIRNNIITFYEENPLNEKICLLLKYRPRFSTEFNDKELEELLEIVPIKYFLKKKNTVEFYFNLVQQIFDDFLTEKICKILSSPLLGGKQSTIGDMLEFILLNDLKNNRFQTFDECINVDTIMYLKEIDNLDYNNIDKKCILLLQTNPLAPSFDFGILNNGEDLVVFQCKKALNSEPLNFPTYTYIYEIKDLIVENFKQKFKIKIKNIYLFFITGISFYFKDGEKKSRTWGNDRNENFDKIEKLCTKSNCLLLYYDVIEKHIYYKQNNSFNEIETLINFVKLNTPVKTEDDSKNIYDKNKYILTELFYKESISLEKRIANYRQKESNEVFLTMENFAFFVKNGIGIKNNIVGVCDNPDETDLLYKNMYIGFKTKRKKYLTIQENNKNRKIYEIKKNEIKETDEDIRKIIKGEIEKCYYYESK